MSRAPQNSRDTISTMARKTLAGLLLPFALLGAAGCSAAPDASDSAPTKSSPPAATQSTTPSPSPSPEPEPTPDPPAFDRTARSLDDPTSIWVVSNKLRPLQPVDYYPADLVYPNIESTNGQPLRQETAEAAERMAAAAASAGAPLRLVSAFRSYDTQVSVYGSFVVNSGQAYADTTSARPGHSEHQTGLTADFDSAAGTDPFGYDACMLDTCFADTPAGQWLAANAADYGFIERYPNGLEGITGFHYEPWHYRFVGVELAQEMRKEGVRTLEEFFGLPAAPDYAG